MKAKEIFAMAGILAVMILAGCPGPVGPAGPAGERGPAGPQGEPAPTPMGDGEIGSVCTSFRDCAGALLCGNGACGIALGGTCTADEDCASPLVCSASGVCANDNANAVCTTNAGCSSGLCNGGTCCAATRTAASTDGAVVLTSRITSDKFLYTCVTTGSSLRFWSNVLPMSDQLGLFRADGVGHMSTHDNITYAELTEITPTTFTSLFSSPRSDSGAGAFIAHCSVSSGASVSLSLCE